jgi:hypothetical protein
MLAISTWLWGDKYGLDDVLKLQRAVARNLKQPHRFLLMTERERVIELPNPIERHAIKDPELLTYKGCFARLRMFDKGWQSNRRIDDRLVCLDLDIVITGRLDDLFNRPEPFVILSGANRYNPCPFNGSVMMLRPGYYEDVWSGFSIEAASAQPYYEFPDDQGWLHYKIPNAATWQCGKSGIFAFLKPGWPSGLNLPSGARIVAFPGRRRPSDYPNLPWIRECWR